MDLTSVTSLSKYTRRGQHSPYIISDGSDKLYFTWIDKTISDVNGDIVLLEYDTNHTMSLLNNQSVARHYHQPKIAKLLSGNIVATWYNDKSDGYGYGVTAKIVDPSLNTVKSNFLVNNFVLNNQLNPSVSSLSKSGGFVITWQSLGQDSKSLTHAIYGKIYDEVGNIIKNDFRISNSTQENQEKPIVTGLKDGGFVVVWQSNTQDGSRREIYAKRYDSSFNDLNSLFRISKADKIAQKAPNIAPLDDGGYVISWQETVSPSRSDSQIFAQIYDADNNIKKNKFLISTHGTTHNKHPGVMGTIGGGFVVTWLGLDPLKSCKSESNFIYGKIFDSTARASDNLLEISYDPKNGKIYPSLAAFKNNSFVIAWHSFDMNKFDFVTYFKVYDLNFANTKVMDTENNEEFLSSFTQTSLITDQIVIPHANQLALSNFNNQFQQFGYVSNLSPSDIYQAKHEDLVSLDDEEQKPLNANQQDSTSTKTYIEYNKFTIDSLDIQLISNSDIYHTKQEDHISLDDEEQKPLNANQQDSTSTKTYIEYNKFTIDSLEGQLISNSDIYHTKQEDHISLDDEEQKPLNANQQDSTSTKIYSEYNQFEINSLESQLISKIEQKDASLIIQKPTQNYFADKVITEKKEQPLSTGNLVPKNIHPVTNINKKPNIVKIDPYFFTAFNGSIDSEIFIIPDNIGSIKIYGFGGNDTYILFPSNNSLVQIMDYDNNTKIAFNDFLLTPTLNILNTNDNKVSIKLPNNQSLILQSEYKISISELNFIFNYSYHTNEIKDSNDNNFNYLQDIVDSPLFKIFSLMLAFDLLYNKVQMRIQQFVAIFSKNPFNYKNLDPVDKGNNGQNYLAKDTREENLDLKDDGSGDDPRNENLDIKNDKQTYDFPNVQPGYSSSALFVIPVNALEAPLEINTPPQQDLAEFLRPFTTPPPFNVHGELRENQNQEPLNNRAGEVRLEMPTQGLTEFSRLPTPPPFNGHGELRENQNQEPLNNDDTFLHTMVDVPASSIGSSSTLQNNDNSISQHALSASHVIVGMPSSAENSSIIIAQTGELV